METQDTLFDAPDEDDPDKPDAREKQERKTDPDHSGGEYILHFRDSLGRFIDPPSRWR